MTEDDAERARDRMADLLKRRADVYSPQREAKPYYGDDDIDLLLAALHSVREERDELIRWRDIYRRNCLRQAVKIAELEKERDEAIAHSDNDRSRAMAYRKGRDNAREERDAAVTEARRATLEDEAIPICELLRKDFPSATTYIVAKLRALAAAPPKD